MSDGLRLLIKLQDIDQTIQKLHTVKADLAREMSEAERSVEKARQSVESGQQESKTLRAVMDKRDGDLRAIEERINKLSVQLNTVKTNKEYSTLQHEIAGVKAEKSRIEDDILKMMDDSEARHREAGALREKLAQAEKECAARKESIARAIADADARCARLEQERAEVRAQVPDEFLQPYERLRHGLRGRALSVCRNSVCQECRMSLTANTVARLMARSQIVLCHSCGRILVLPENEDDGEAARA